MPQRSSLLLALLPLLTVTGWAEEREPERIEVLFLGDDRGHDPIGRYRVLKQALGPRGYNLSFLEDLSQLTRGRLDRYDSLVVYANHEQDELPPALLAWVRDGGGLVALHCASACFQPSQEWIGAIGGRFDHHEGHVFSPENVDPAHPITADLPPLEAWDETYVHRDLGDDRHLLQVRPPIHADESEPEPWTWLREEGEGRVFYTASGHDLRVWNEPAYQELVARAIVWSAGPEIASAFEALELPPLELAEPRIRDRAHPEIPMMPLQGPLSAAQSARHTQVPAGTRLELFASEPMIVNPIAIDWDARGRAWVVESFGYPNDVPADPGEGEDRIKILEDSNGDGKADKVTVFAEGLRHCTTTAFVRSGVIATDGTEIVYLPDDNGDDRADRREVLARGLNIWDTHASTSHFLYGMDNWIYATVGYSGIDMQLQGEHHKFGQALFRFRPDLSKLEFLQPTTNNTWGLGFSNEGEVLGSTANNNPSWQLSIPAAAYRDSGIEQPRTPRLDDQPFLYPNTRDITQVDQIERYTAAAGHMLYNDRFFNDIVAPDTALICEPTGHLVAAGAISGEGSTRTIDLRGNNVFASADAWASPVAARPGPDGAIWIADWYNPIIQHNVVFRFWNPARGYDKPHSPYHAGSTDPGKGNAYVTPLRDRKHGRIWRIVPVDGNLRSAPRLDIEHLDKVLETLNSPSQHLRLQAQRMLVERGQPDIIAPLTRMVGLASTPDGLDRPYGAYHALRTLGALVEAGHGAAREPIVSALGSSDQGLRHQAMLSLPPGDPMLVARLPELLAGAAGARDRTRVLIVCALAPPNDPLARALLADGLRNGQGDETTSHAIRLAMRRQGATILAAALASDETPSDWILAELEELTRRIAAGPNRAAAVAIIDGASAGFAERLAKVLEEAPTAPVVETPLPAHLVAGREAYLKSCVECHQADGSGVENTFPPLEGSEWVAGDPRTLLRIMLGGLMGPITVKGEEYDSAMPGHSHASDEELAAVASYVRYQFGDRTDEKPIEPEQVRQFRPEVEARKFAPWTIEEIPREP